MVTSPGPAVLVFPVSLQVPGSLRGAAGSRVGAADRAATARRAALDAAARELDNRGDGFELDVPDTPANAAAFGYASGENRSAFPKVRVVTVGECGSHAKIAAQGPVHRCPCARLVLPPYAPQTGS